MTKPKATIKGYYIKEAIKYVEKERGPEGLSKLEKKYGSSLDFSSFNDYPMEDYTRLKKAAIEVLSNDQVPPTEFEIGKFAFEIFYNTTVGKAMFALGGRNFKRAALTVGKVVTTLTKGLDLNVEDMGGNKIKIVMKNSAYDIKQYEGLMYAAVAKMGFKPTTSSKALPDGAQEFTISWEE